jgi:hypothetical protein
MNKEVINAPRTTSCSPLPQNLLPYDGANLMNSKEY